MISKLFLPTQFIFIPIDLNTFDFLQELRNIQNAAVAEYSDLLNAAQFSLNNRLVEKEQLASQAINIERHILGENVGIQDQYTTALGGLVNLSISDSGRIAINDTSAINPLRIGELSSHLLLFFTGKQRYASEVLVEQMQKTRNGSNDNLLLETKNLVGESLECLRNDKRNILDLGALFDHGWKLKKSLSNNVSNEFIDKIYDTGINSGALGGKLIGAGNGGFILFFAEPRYHETITKNLHFLKRIDCSFDYMGTQLTHFD
jgi:D-glycero-alpha-D-manno-heptose-7-phosphate kinase